MQLDYQLQAFKAYIDGVGYAGAGEKLTTPAFKKMMEKRRGGGMLAARNHAHGYEPFEMTFEFSSYEPRIIKMGGLFSRKGVPLSVTAAFDGDRDARHSASFVCAGQFSEVDGAEFTPGKPAMLKAKALLDRLKLTIDGDVIYDIDVEADKYLVNGVDEYAWIRNALG